MARITSVGSSDDNYTPPVQSRSIVMKAFLGVVFFFGILTLYLGQYTVDQGEVGILKRNGAAIDAIDPGRHLKIPFIDEVVPMEVRVRAAHLAFEGSSKDPMLVPVEATVNWTANKKSLVYLYSEYGSLEQFEQRSIMPIFQDSIKTATAKFTVNDLLLDRDKLRDAALASLKANLPLDVMSVTHFSVTNIDFPKPYKQQVLDKQVAAEAVKTEQYKLEQQNLQAQQRTQTAQADAAATKAKADGDAYATKVNGQAVADAITIKGKALANNPLVVDYEKVQRWGGTFPTTFMGGATGANLLWSLPSSSADSTLSSRADK